MTGAKISREQVAGMNIHYVNYSLDYFLDTQRKLGFRTIELWCGAPHVGLDHLGYYEAAALKKKIAARDLRVCVVTPENCLYPYQVGAKEAALRERSFAYFRNGILLAEELEVPMMEINSGWGYWNEPREEAWKRSQEMLSRLAEEAAAHGVTLVMENLRPEESQIVTTLEDTKRMIAAVGSPAFKPMADLCAVSVAGETLEDWFLAFGKDLRHMHFIDGDPYGHLVWGDGIHHLGKEIAVLNQYGYTGCLGQELTEGKYFADPAAADFRNMKNFERYIYENGEE
ncbi:TIM barrel protein [Anaerotignum lactatifermentans]|uniref:TIM barrel protein n=1 Tax=Anaerotignum lactatifermentans TaxID=160404 RepID=A0ABS2GBH8_9FIRM|nr:sugar phosphate isomerase/epimerase family protein [Anaerotignum lactatifermentans]MBM6830242.1 TIM barrel protein [Anaerotignum lactatifermentans]MBM6878834.1 TIM barrel protein [Anaerotignum lactatifermentans]MBM6951855.1 TIM barrel protein [Anaerotignum lactatifermentans]